MFTPRKNLLHNLGLVLQIYEGHDDQLNRPRDQWLISHFVIIITKFILGSIPFS
jgi:hypothetical protein